MFRYLRWIVLGMGVLLVLLAVGLGVYTNTEAFRQLVRRQMIAAINESIPGSVSLERIEGSIWGEMTLHEVRLSYEKADIVRVPRLRLSYALLPLLRGELQIAGAEASKPVVALVRDARGRWNIVEALSSDTKSDTGLAVFLKSLILRDGSLDLRLSGKEPKEFHLRNVALAGRVSVEPAGVDFEAREVSARLQSQMLPDLGIKGALSYRDGGAPPSVKVRGLRLETATSRLNLEGELANFDKMTIAAKLAIEKLSPPDLLRFVPQWPVKQDLAGTIQAKGPFEALAVGVDISAAGAKARGDFTIDAAAPTPRYRGKVAVAAIDARSWLPTEKISGVLEGNAEVRGRGPSLKELSVVGEFNVRSAQVRDWRVGDVRVRARIEKSAVVMDGALQGALGGADWRGEVTLSGVPRYAFDIAVKDLDVQKVSGQGKALDGVLSFKGTVKGSGLTVAEMNTQANLKILASSVGPVRLQAGELAASLRDGRIRIARGSLSTADATLTLKGDLGLDLTQRGELDYEFRSADISPWLALVGRQGSGALALAGSAQGHLADLKTKGKARIAALRLDGVALKNGDIIFDLTRADNRSVPEGMLTVRLSDIEAGVQLQRLDGTVRLRSDPSFSAQIDVKAQDRYSGIHTLRGAVDYGRADIVARAEEIAVSLPDGTWRLSRPASVTKRADMVLLEKFILRNGDRELSLDGRIASSGTQTLNVGVVRFPLESLAAYLPKQPKVTGIVSAQARIGGTAAAPVIAGAIQLSESTIGGQRYAGLVADVGYKEKLAHLALTVRQDSAHSLTATGGLPLALSWSDGFRSEVTGDLNLRVRSSGLSLAFLNAYAEKNVNDIAGELSLDLVARGAPTEPVLSGQFRLSNGQFKVVSAQVEVNGVTAEGSMDARTVTIHNFSARANDGRLQGSGSIALKKYQIGSFKLSLAARRWPAVWTRRYQAHIDGSVGLEGTLGEPTISGNIDVTEARLRPELDFLSRATTPVKRDEAIVIVNGKDRSFAAKNNRGEGFGDVDPLKKFALDLTVVMPGNVWVSHPDLSAELKGSIHIAKRSDENLELVGSAEIIRGWAAFQGRRFYFVRGEMEFVGGGKIDPSLDIVAQHRLPKYTVDAVVGGSADKPTLTLRSNPPLDQADILALLLFGKPTQELNRSEQASLKQNALDVTSGFAAARIGAAVSEALGLEGLGVDIGALEFNGGRVGFGRYVGRQTYVSVTQDIAGEKGQGVSVEYQIAPDWKFSTATTSSGSSEIELIWHKRY